MTAAMKVLLLVVNETDMWHELPLYKAIVQRLHQLEIAGATAHAGIMGFGRHHRVHHKGLFGISDDRPITILAVDTETKLRDAIAGLRPMMSEGVIVLLDAEVLPVGAEAP